MVIKVRHKLVPNIKFSTTTLLALVLSIWCCIGTMKVIIIIGSDELPIYLQMFAVVLNIIWLIIVIQNHRLVVNNSRYILECFLAFATIHHCIATLKIQQLTTWSDLVFISFYIMGCNEILEILFIKLCELLTLSVWSLIWIILHFTIVNKSYYSEEIFWLHLGFNLGQLKLFERSFPARLN